MSCSRTHYGEVAKDQTGPGLLLQSTPKTMLLFFKMKKFNNIPCISTKPKIQYKTSKTSHNSFVSRDHGDIDWDSRNTTINSFVAYIFGED